MFICKRQFFWIWRKKVAKLVSGKRIAHLWYNSSFKNWQLLRTVRSKKVMKFFILAFLAVIAVSSSEGKPKFEFCISSYLLYQNSCFSDRYSVGISVRILEDSWRMFKKFHCQNSDNDQCSIYLMFFNFSGWNFADDSGIHWEIWYEFLNYLEIFLKNHIVDEISHKDWGAKKSQSEIFKIESMVEVLM